MPHDAELAALDWHGKRFDSVDDETSAGPYVFRLLRA
jgi:hypothetical protein